MKIHRKNRIINTNTTNIGLILVGSKCSITDKKELNLNKTKLYHKDNNYITIVSGGEWQGEVHLENIMDKKDILHIIDIYHNKLFIIHVNYETVLKGYSEKLYLDLFKHVSTSIYNDIYLYNKSYKCYLNTVMSDSNKDYNIPIKVLYYYLIGYV
jgi:hypothetical protein